jgi:RNA polymerase sigma-70 factor (ECF subfamily)
MPANAANVLLRELRTFIAGQTAEGQTDQCLLEQFLALRDEASFAALLERHGAMVLGVCRRVLHDEHLAEDAFQATFLVLAHKAATIRKRQSVGSWLHGVAFRLASKAKVDAARSKHVDARTRSHAVVDPLTEASWHEAQAILDDELQRLAENYRLPLILSQLIRRGVTLSAAGATTLLADSVLSASVSPFLAVATVHAAARVAAGATLAACGVSASVVALTEGGVKMMISKKITLMVAFVLVTGLVAAGAGLVAQSGAPVETRQSNEPPAWVVAQDPVKTQEPRQAKQRPVRDAQLLRGTWTVSQARADGISVESESWTGDDQIWSIADGTITIKYKGGQKKILTFRLDATKTPKAVDVTEEGGATYLGIYELDGDRLEIAYSRSARKERLQAFVEPTLIDRGLRHFVLQRQVKEPAEAHKLWHRFRDNPNDFFITFAIRPGNALQKNPKRTFTSVTLHVDDRSDPIAVKIVGQDSGFPPEPIAAGARISERQAVDIIDVLHEWSQFFKYAVERPEEGEEGQGRHLQIVIGQSAATKGSTLTLAHDWNWKTLGELTAIQARVDGQAATVLDQLLKEIREQLAESPAPARNPRQDAKPIDPELLRKLAAAVRSKDYEERAAALKELTKLLAVKGDGATDFEPLIEPLFSGAGWGGIESYNARMAEDLLVRIGKPALRALTKRLKSEDAHDRRVAAELLVRIGPLDASLAALLRPLLADRDEYVRRAAIDGLAVVGAPAEDAVKDLEAVATSDPILLRRVSARVALIRIAGASEERVRALAAFLKPMKQPNDPSAKDQANGPDHEVARFAASELGTLEAKASAAMPQLLAALKHTDGGVRVNAAAALGRVGAFNSPETIAALIDLVKNDPEREARRSAAGALGNIGPKAKAAIPALRAALKGDGKGGWWVAAEALGRIGGEEVVPALVEGLASADEGVRSTSMKALGNLGTIAKPAIAALEKARQEDARPGNRAIAAEALRRIEQALQKK